MPTSAAALRWAVAEAAAGDRGVRAVAAWTYVPAVDPGAWWPHRRGGRRPRRALDEFVREVLGEQPAIPVRADLVEGEAGEVLLQAADDASLLVLGSHGRGRLMRALLGSVSAQCLRRALSRGDHLAGSGGRGRGRCCRAGRQHRRHSGPAFLKGIHPAHRGHRRR
jgi:nucleotide-binding universal stress UspA family protein